MAACEAAGPGGFGAVCEAGTVWGAVAVAVSISVWRSGDHGGGDSNSEADSGAVNHALPQPRMHGPR